MKKVKSIATTWAEVLIILIVAGCLAAIMFNSITADKKIVVPLPIKVKILPMPPGHQVYCQNGSELTARFVGVKSVNLDGSTLVISFTDSSDIEYYTPATGESCRQVKA